MNEWIYFLHTLEIHCLITFILRHGGTGLGLCIVRTLVSSMFFLNKFQEFEILSYDFLRVDMVLSPLQGKGRHEQQFSKKSSTLTIISWKFPLGIGFKHKSEDILTALAVSNDDRMIYRLTKWVERLKL